MANEHATETAPELTDVVTAYAEAVVEKRGGPQLATVQTYDGRHTATVQPLVTVPVNGVFLPPPIFTVAVGWPSDGGPSPAFAATFPIKPGSLVQLVPHKYDESTYKESGAVGQPPATERRMDLTDAIARPVAAAAGVPLPANAFAPDGYVIFAQPFLYLGGADATDFVALASLVVSELQKAEADRQAMKTVYDTHQHPETGVTTGVPLVPFSPQTPPGNVASTVVKSK